MFGNFIVWILGGIITTIVPLTGYLWVGYNKKSKQVALLESTIKQMEAERVKEYEQSKKLSEIRNSSEPVDLSNIIGDLGNISSLPESTEGSN